MNFSILRLIADTVHLAKRDSIVLVPYLMFNIITQTTTNSMPKVFSAGAELSTRLMAIFVIWWTIEMLFKGITITMAHTLSQDKTLDVGASIAAVTRSFFKLIFATALLVIPVIGTITLLGPLSSSGTATGFLATLFGFIIVMFIIMFMTLIPIIILLNPSFSVRDTYAGATTFIRGHAKDLIVFLSMTLCLLMLSLLLSAIFGGVPVLGASVFPAFFNGIAYALTQIMGVLFYLHITGKRRLSSAQEEESV